MPLFGYLVGGFSILMRPLEVSFAQKRPPTCIFDRFISHSAAIAASSGRSSGLVYALENLHTYSRSNDVKHVLSICQ